MREISNEVDKHTKFRTEDRELIISNDKNDANILNEKINKANILLMHQSVCTHTIYIFDVFFFSSISLIQFECWIVAAKLHMYMAETKERERKRDLYICHEFSDNEAISECRTMVFSINIYLFLFIYFFLSFARAATIAIRCISKTLKSNIYEME